MWKGGTGRVIHRLIPTSCCVAFGGSASHAGTADDPTHRTGDELQNLKVVYGLGAATFVVAVATLVSATQWKDFSASPAQLSCTLHSDPYVARYTLHCDPYVVQ
jgi:hypothetical protein